MYENSRIFHSRNALVTPTTYLPVSINDVKNFMRLAESTAEEDSLIGSYISAAHRFVESYTNRILLSESYQLRLDFYPTKTINLPVANVTSITSVQYIDTNGATQTVSSSNYDVDLNTIPAKIYTHRFEVPAYDTTRKDCVIVNFVAGYSGPSAIPAGLKIALMMIVGYLYENRASHTAIKDSVSWYFNHLLDPYTYHIFS